MKHKQKPFIEIMQVAIHPNKCNSWISKCDHRNLRNSMNFKGYQFMIKSKGREGGKKPWVANYRIVTRCISLDA